MSERLHRIAAEIERLHRDKAPFEQLQGEFALESIVDAYAAQNALQELRANGARGPVAGRKIALASRVQQELCGIDHPIAGAIYQNEIHASPATIALKDYHGLGIEYEIALSLDQDTEVGRSYARPDVAKMISGVHPAFEMIIDRDADYRAIDPKTMIADNAWCAGIVLGADIGDALRRDFDDIEHALSGLPATLVWNGDSESATTAASDPIGSLTWVVNLLSGLEVVLEAGQPVITGSVMKTRYPAADERNGSQSAPRTGKHEPSEVTFTLGDYAGITLSIV